MRSDILNSSRYYAPSELLKLTGINHPPVDVYEIANYLGVQVTSDFDFDEMGLSGKISWSDDRSTAVIWINPFDGERRQRFTLSHELGHLFCHMLPAYKDTSKDESFTDGSKHFRRDGSISPVEREANKFSADLLMPADMLAREAKELADSHRAPSGKVAMSKSDFIELLADKFQVSNQAMEYRLKNLRII